MLEDLVRAQRLSAAVLRSDGNDAAVGDRELLEDLLGLPAGGV
jgi:hypothetical protein